MNSKAGSRLIMKADEMDSFTRLGKEVLLWGLDRDNKMGEVRIAKVVRAVVGVTMLITFIWSCTNSLAPKTNGLLLSFKS